MTIYVDLTREFNAGGLRAILSSGQAVVRHRLDVMSKDGDWILRETPDALEHVLGALARRGARYRFGAPLDVRWMEGGWSAHFEFALPPLRVRTDFVTRPPRIPPADLEALWREQSASTLPFVDARRLVELEKTNREKDYAVIGELARLLPTARERLLASRSARDLEALARADPGSLRDLVARRPLLGRLGEGVAAVERALDAERRALMHEHDERLQRYLDAVGPWQDRWPSVERETEGMSFADTHRVVVARAEGVLPFRVAGGTGVRAPRDEFSSEEDLDLENLPEDELFAWWRLWLEQAQGSNDLDAHTYSHGVFALEPPRPPETARFGGSS